MKRLKNVWKKIQMPVAVIMGMLMMLLFDFVFYITTFKDLFSSGTLTVWKLLLVAVGLFDGLIGGTGFFVILGGDRVYTWLHEDERRKKNEKK